MRVGERRSVGVTVLLLVTLAGAGCFGDTPTPVLDDGEVAFDDPRAIRITGFVVDEDLYGLADAQVTLQPGDRSTKTDAMGAFGLAVLEPGLYQLTAERAGRDPTVTDVDVPRAGVSGLFLVLRPSPDGVPYRETMTFVSHAICHGPTGGGCVAVNDVAGQPVVPAGSPDFQYEIAGDGLKEVLFEAEWDEHAFAGPGSFVARNPEGVFLLNCNATNPEGFEPFTKVYYTGPDAGPEGVAEVSSPARFWVRAGDVNPAVGGCHAMPTEKGTLIHQGVQIQGGPGTPLGCCGVDVRVTVYLTFFYWQTSLDRSFSVLGAG